MRENVLSPFPQPFLGVFGRGLVVGSVVNIVACIGIVLQRRFRVGIIVVAIVDEFVQLVVHKPFPDNVISLVEFLADIAQVADERLARHRGRSVVVGCGGGLEIRP